MKTIKLKHQPSKNKTGDLTDLSIKHHQAFKEFSVENWVLPSRNWWKEQPDMFDGDVSPTKCENWFAQKPDTNPKLKILLGKILLGLFTFFRELRYKNCLLVSKGCGFRSDKDGKAIHRRLPYLDWKVPRFLFSSSHWHRGCSPTLHPRAVHQVHGWEVPPCLIGCMWIFCVAVQNDEPLETLQDHGFSSDRWVLKSWQYRADGNSDSIKFLFEVSTFSMCVEKV